jgi:hypothetical protein
VLEVGEAVNLLRGRRLRDRFHPLHLYPALPCRAIIGRSYGAWGPRLLANLRSDRTAGAAVPT